MVTEAETDDEVEIDDETITRIRDRVLSAEKEQLHLKQAYNIMPQIREIIEDEVK